MEYRIRPATDSTFGTLRTYFTACDPVVQARPGSASVDELTAKLRALSLIQDSVTIAASHVVGSPAAFELVRRNRELLTDGAIVPAMNTEYDSFLDMVETKCRSEQHTRPWRPDSGSVEESVLLERASFLDDHTRDVLGWDIADMQSTFERSLLRDLEDDESGLHAAISGTSDPTVVRERIVGIDHLTRRALYERTADLSRPVRATLLDYANVNYHLTGATFHHATPQVIPTEIDVLTDRIRRSIELGDENDPERVADLESRPLSGDTMFREYLNVVGFGTDTLLQLDAEDIVTLRRDRITEDFRRTLLDTVEDVAQRPDTTAEYLDLRDEFRTAVRSRLDAEATRRRRVKRLLDLSLYAGGVGATIAGAEELGLSLTVADPLLRKLVDYLPNLVGNEFTAFEQHYHDYTRQGRT